MLRALYSSASGMEAQQMNLDVIANNLANVNTTGFKKSKVEFQDLLYQTKRMAGAEQGAGNQVPSSLQVGHGSRPVATAKVFTTGELSQTSEKMDIAIKGNGFFKVQRPDGSNAWTRDGAFKLNSTGAIVTSDGLPVLSFAGITIDSTINAVASPTQPVFRASATACTWRRPPLAQRKQARRIKTDLAHWHRAISSFPT